jgi:hypothetical protein
MKGKFAKMLASLEQKYQQEIAGLKVFFLSWGFGEEFFGK